MGVTAVVAATAVSAGSAVSQKISANTAYIDAQNTASHQQELDDKALADQKQKDKDNQTLATAQATQDQQLQALKGINQAQGRAGTILTGPLGNQTTNASTTVGNSGTSQAKTVLGS